MVNFNFAINIPKCQSNTQNDYFFITYNSDFFSLYLNNESYYGGEDYHLKLYTYLYQDNSKENFSLRLELINTTDNQIDYIVEKSYYYVINERCIYTDTTLIGMIPIFIEANLLHNQQVTLAEFNNSSLEGIHKEKDRYIVIKDKKIEYHYVLTDDTYGNYTCYYYSDYENILIWWEIGNNQEITLKNLFNITTFGGHIFMESTNFDIKWIEYSPMEHLYSLIITIVILATVFISILVIFLLIRKKFKADYQKKRKTPSSRRKKKKGIYGKW